MLNYLVKNIIITNLTLFLECKHSLYNKIYIFNCKWNAKYEVIYTVYRKRNETKEKQNKNEYVDPINELWI